MLLGHIANGKDAQRWVPRDDRATEVVDPFLAVLRVPNAQRYVFVRFAACRAHEGPLLLGDAAAIHVGDLERLTRVIEHILLRDDVASLQARTRAQGWRCT